MIPASTPSPSFSLSSLAQKHSHRKYYLYYNCKVLLNHKGLVQFFIDSFVVLQWKEPWKKTLVLAMDGMYGFHPTDGDYSDKAVLMMSPDNLMFPSDYQTLLCSSAGDNRVSDVFGSDELLSAAASALSSEAASIAPEIPRNDDNVSLGVIKAKIACHPLYPRLLQSYIDCQKVILLLVNSLFIRFCVLCMSCLFNFFLGWVL